MSASGYRDLEWSISVCKDIRVVMPLVVARFQVLYSPGVTWRREHEQQVLLTEIVFSH